MMKSLLTLSFMPCHRIPERSLTVGSYQFPLCYRCMGIMLGMGFGIMVNWIYFRASLFMVLGACLLIPMLIDGYTQKWKWRSSTNFLRLTTGVMFGWGLAVEIVYVAQRLIALILSL
ncbi:DUF2085 domain-containing protein [Rossellomorea aquimaris]|uniref:DUF2085 domain-containing protein n=1 Tax=Rossellomorea aquimaris TaxID=189382 RepID=UPI001CD6A54A|nr:DUF2085 domain-containing protein [Rossellomorea aquimaris]MCA1054511.1 DUF2085 domain-containing protein [Rossellomorea aquimaris]